MYTNKAFASGCILITLLGMSLSVASEDKVTNEAEATINATDNSVYPASFFEQYLPQNALEMVERLPGFNFDRGSDARGFGGNAGNVLIDGARPTSKSGGLRSALVRMPASQVERIEILRGGISSGEAAGQTIVANVIRKKNVTSGSWAFKERWVNHERIRPNLEAAITTQLGVWDSSFDIDIGANPRYRTAIIETNDAENQLIFGSDEVLSELNEFAFINAEGARDVGKGRLTLNARIGGNRHGSNTTRDLFDGRLPEGSSRDRFWELGVIDKNKMAELGSDWSHSNDDWKWRVIGLGLIDDDQFDNQFHIETIASGAVSDSSFSQDALTTELIARTTYGKVSGSNFKPEFGFEVAKNKLSSDAVSFLDGVQQKLNGGDVEVEELRAEIFSSFVYTANNQLSIDAGLTAEISRIKVSGDASQRQTFNFIKPRISATYKFNKDHQLALELERKVGQLDFNDFAASSQVSDDRTTSGNPDLEPNQTNEIVATYDWSFSERGSLKIKAFHEWQKGLLEQILLPSGGQGIGNAGNARLWGLETNINLPLDPVLKNGLLEIWHFFSDSTFDDPFINRSRRINGYSPNWLTFKLRQDLTQHKFAWGIEYFGNFKDQTFFVDEKQTFSGNKRYRFFVESSRFFGVKTQLEVTDLNTADLTRSRFIFDADRGGKFAGAEIAHRQRRPQVKLTFSRNF